MRVVVVGSESTWTTTPEWAAAVEAELRALGHPFVRTPGTYTWAEGSMDVLVYRFNHDIHVGPVFDAFDRLRAAGAWIYGRRTEISPYG